MDLKFYDHNNRRWMEGEFEGRWFALHEDGDRLVLETPMVGHGCFTGTTNRDGFAGRRIGVLQERAAATAWLFNVAVTAPQRIDRQNHTRGKIRIPIPGATLEPLVC